jgi:uncharacterized membrane protein
VSEAWARQLTRWIDAGLIDEPTATRIRGFELEHADSSRLRWPIWIALAFGALTIAAGTLLFVSAHWDSLSPSARFGLVLALVAVFHVGGAFASERFPAMGTTLHAIGTVTLGAGIYLAGQVFNLDEHWPGGLMMWSLGAALAWVLLRTWPQLALLAMLGPAWLLGEWSVALQNQEHWTAAGYRISACGVFLLALAYFTNTKSEPAGPQRRVLLWLGGIALIPAAAVVASESMLWGYYYSAQPLSIGLRVVGWTAAIGLPSMLSIGLRGSAAWPNLLAAAWTVVALWINPTGGDVYVYAWWALGAVALAAWGVKERRTERINIGAVFFGATVLTFYFSHVMDQLGRSASLMGLGLLFLAGGWAIERTRRRLVVGVRGGLAS